MYCIQCVLSCVLWLIWPIFVEVLLIHASVGFYDNVSGMVVVVIDAFFCYWLFALN